MTRKQENKKYNEKVYTIRKWTFNKTIAQQICKFKRFSLVTIKEYKVNVRKKENKDKKEKKTERERKKRQEREWKRGKDQGSGAIKGGGKRGEG